MTYFIAVIKLVLFVVLLFFFYTGNEYKANKRIMFSSFEISKL